MDNQQFFAPMPVVQQYNDPNQISQIHYQQPQGSFPRMQPMAPYYSMYQQQQPIMQYPQLQNQDPQTPYQQDQSDWTTVLNKKRLRSPEVLNARKQTRISDYWLQKPLETKNSYNSLSEENDENKDEKQQSKTKEIPKPPPITIYNVGVIQHIHDLLKQITNNKYTIKTISYETIKVQVIEAEHFKTLIKELDSRNTQYHTFRPKSEKTFRFVLRGLHHGTDSEEIKKSLAEQGHEVVNIHNIKHRTTKKPLPMFYIDITPKENNKHVYNLDKLGNNIIKCEPPHTKRIIPQCTRCQAYGHTKTYCRKISRCVKCSGQHETKECTRKTRDDKVKCVNCGGDHPANYRGCLVHKQLQQKLYPTLREKRNPQQQIQLTSTQHIQPGTSYAQTVNNNKTQNNQVIPIINQPVNNMSKLEEMMGKLMEQMSTMLNLLTTVVNKLA